MVIAPPDNPSLDLLTVREFQAYKLKNNIYIFSNKKYTYREAMDFCLSKGYMLVPYDKPENKGSYGSTTNQISAVTGIPCVMTSLIMVISFIQTITILVVLWGIVSSHCRSLY